MGAVQVDNESTAGRTSIRAGSSRRSVSPSRWSSGPAGSTP